MSLISNVTKTVQTIGKVAKKTYGPLAALESDTDPKNFRYPLDVGESTVYPHTVEFQCFVPCP